METMLGILFVLGCAVLGVVLGWLLWMAFIALGSGLILLAMVVRNLLFVRSKRR